MPKNRYQVAILIDAGFLLHKLYPIFGHRYPTADEVLQYASSTLNQEEEKLFRIYFYDSPPFEGARQHPLTKKVTDFSMTETCRSRKSLHDTIQKKNNVAFRAGNIKFGGWVVKNKKIDEIISQQRDIVESDISPAIQQKRVDMKIGLDVAWLSSKRIVDRLIIITDDSDFVPALKFARREGVQVIVASPSRSVSQDLQPHLDEFRYVPVAGQSLTSLDDK